MIFIANALPINGGTTFLIRACREMHRRGQKVAVLVMFPLVDEKLRVELERYAQVFDLRDYLWDRGVFFRMQLMTFAPVRWRALLDILGGFGTTVHVMGIFGLLFACRLSHRLAGVRATIGVYHQNEYLFDAQDTYFVRAFRHYFSAIPASQFLFFNQANVTNYSRFFETDFSTGTIAPIGIEISEELPQGLPAQVRGKLVSVGNLVNFKTYNGHIIRIVAALVDRYPELHYDIYGSGSEENDLKALAESLGIKNRIHFFGPMMYSDFGKNVGQAALFIGSGTAVLEAAALRIPAMIGIESIKQAETYGFLSDIDGYSYNEYLSDVPRFSMQNLIERVLSDQVYAEEIASACREKAKEFSIESTINSITTLSDCAQTEMLGLNNIECMRLCCSFVGVALLDALHLSSTFRNRRDQSYGLM